MELKSQMNNQIFKGSLKDFLDAKKLEIDKCVRFGILDPQTLLTEFIVNPPNVDFTNPVDIIRIDNGILSEYIFIFTITGNTEVLDYRPTVAFAEMLEWLVRDGRLWIRVPEEDLETMKVKVDGIIETMRSHLLDVAHTISEYNNSLQPTVTQLITAHTSRINENHPNSIALRNYLLFRD